MKTALYALRHRLDTREPALPPVLPTRPDSPGRHHGKVEEIRRAAVQQERARIAGELHDTVAQTLATILVHLQVLDATLGDGVGEAREQLDRVRELTRDGLTDVRRTLDGLRCPALEAGALGPALEYIAMRATDGAGLDVHFQESGTRRPLPASVEHELLRIVQEALTNIVRHARARNVQVELRYEPTRVTLRVQDDGRGFIAVAPTPGHYGLTGMRERADRAGATLTIRSAPFRGTEILVTVDLASGKER